MKIIIISGIVIIAAFLIVLSFIPLGIEPLTELYINNHTDLPKNVYLDKTYNFSFTTHNLEYQDVAYNYTVKAYDVNGTLISELYSGTFTLPHNESKTIKAEYRFHEPFKSAKIEVKITKNLIGEPDFKRKLWWMDPNYPTVIDVHFWVDEIVQTQIIIVPD